MSKLLPTIGDRLDVLPQSDLFLISVAGLAAQLERFFPDRKVPVVQTAGTSHLRALFQREKKVRYPLFAIQLQTTEQNINGYNPFVLYKRGRALRDRKPLVKELAPETNSTDPVDNQYHLLPATVTFRVLFLASDIQDVYRLCQRWLAASRMHYLDFRLQPDNREQAAIHIKVNLEPTINFPDLEIEEIGENFTVELILSMDTYHGVIAQQTRLEAINLNWSSVEGGENAEDDARLTNLARRILVRRSEP